MEIKEGGAYTFFYVKLIQIREDRAAKNKPYKEMSIEEQITAKMKELESLHITCRYPGGRQR